MEVYEILSDGTKEEMLTLEGTNLLYDICRDFSSMDIILRDKDHFYHSHYDGYFGDAVCHERLHPLDEYTDEQLNTKFILLQPLGENDGLKPDRLYYIAG